MESDVLVINEAERTVQMFVTDPVLVGFLSFMLLWFAISLYQISKSYGSIQKRLRNVTNDMISGADMTPDDLKRVPMTDDVNRAWTKAFETNDFKRLWSGIRCNIIVYRGTGYVSMPRSFLNDKFSAEAIERDYVPLKLGRRATFLISIGVLGTFLGLALGVNEAASGLASPNMRIARAALTDLLDGAGLAFITSLFGLGMGTVLNWHVGRHQQKLKNAVAHFQDSICEMINVVSDNMMVCSSVATGFGDLQEDLAKIGSIIAHENNHNRLTLTAATSPLEVALESIKKTTDGIQAHFSGETDVKTSEQPKWGLEDA